jgi:2-(3-amino-3-carboxypropyl)histidine synthase
MIKKSITELEEEYDLELARIIKTIKKEKAKKVLLQFPDGLKPYATVIVEYLEEKIPSVEFFIWLGSCYGACDVPDVKEKDFDLIIQFGHSSWSYGKDSGIKVVK